MKNINEVYKKLLKEFPNWKTELHNQKIITLEKDSFYIYADEDKVGINKKYNMIIYLDEHRHPDSIENMYEDIVYYINNKDVLLQKQIRKDKVFIVCLAIILVLFIVLSFIVN